MWDKIMDVMNVEPDMTATSALEYIISGDAEAMATYKQIRSIMAKHPGYVAYDACTKESIGEISAILDCFECKYQRLDINDNMDIEILIDDDEYICVNPTDRNREIKHSQDLDTEYLAKMVPVIEMCLNKDAMRELAAIINKYEDIVRVAEWIDEAEDYNN